MRKVDEEELIELLAKHGIAGIVQLKVLGWPNEPRLGNARMARSEQAYIKRAQSGSKSLAWQGLTNHRRGLQRFDTYREFKTRANYSAGDLHLAQLKLDPAERAAVSSLVSRHVRSGPLGDIYSSDPFGEAGGF